VSSTGGCKRIGEGLRASVADSVDKPLRHPATARCAKSCPAVYLAGRQSIVL